MGYFKNSTFSAKNVFYCVRFLPQRSSKNLYVYWIASLFAIKNSFLFTDIIRDKCSPSSAQE